MKNTAYKIQCDSIKTLDIPNLNIEAGTLIFDEDLKVYKVCDGNVWHTIDTFANSVRSIAQIESILSDTTSITVINTNTDVNLTSSTIDELTHFTVTDTNEFTYNGEPTDILFLGDANIDCLTEPPGSSIYTVSMVLQYNGADEIISPVGFAHKDSPNSFSANRLFMNVQDGDTFQLKIKADNICDVAIKDFYVQLVEL